MLSIEQLLVPISVTEPCGEDLSFSAEVDAIARARQHDDPSLEQGEWTVALKEADWPFVASHCAALIQTRSKDLKLAVWLTEAQARTQQFRGLADGFGLLAALCDRYWERVHPLGEDDFEQRIGNLSWLLSQTPQLVKDMPVSEDGSITMLDFERARQSASRAEQPGQPTIAELDARRRGNSEAFNVALLEDADYCLSALRALEQAVDTRLGADGPSFAAAREAVQHAIDFIGLLAPEPDVALVDGEETGGRPSAHSGALCTRTQALAQLRQIADFFRRTEPHSPVAYLAQKAAAWGDMPLHEWLHSVVKDPALAAQLDELLGAG
ncbi:type VI secretion system protein TssA [Pseudoduganella sp. RAF53_2]|uniref:type VI secretion system protein TssA n=1 Tax=unclassified Pseudoduganella TaxID=2637179 RepID=UPI003F9A540E